MAEVRETTREEFILNRIGGLMGLKRNFDKYKKSFESEDNVRALNLFLADSDEVGHLFVSPSGADGVTLTTSAPTAASLKRKIMLMFKTVRGVAITNGREQIGFVELSKQVLESLSTLSQEVYLPVLSNPANQAGWSDLVSKDLIENKFHQFLSQVYVTIGEVHGRTMLPVPPQETTASDRTSRKDKAQVLEGAVITWTKQIKSVLKQDPENVLKTGADPNPLAEIDFWKNKTENLNSIHKQLQSDKIKRVLKFLEQTKSTYTSQFAKLTKEVQAARLEANDNYKYLKTLEDLFVVLTSDSTELSEVEQQFIPILHTILLIWNHSQYYNTPARLVVLIREICNAVINQARSYLGGKEIFEFITNEETSKASERLGNILEVCGKFKQVYFDYKVKANNAWKITTNALFVRLDAFMERCQDIQHLTNTIVQFTKLQKIEIGGTKGKTLTATVKQIFTEFEKAVETFKAVDYDIMDIAAKQFDDDFYAFRTNIKELERRLASVLTQGFDDADTIYGRFKLLESFEGLLTRPIIQDELEKKHITLLDSYKQDLKAVQMIFLEFKPLVDSLADKSPVPKNMPPVTGAINWARGLMDRIKEPMEKLSSLSQAVLEREEFKDVQKLYANLMKALTEYQSQRIDEWATEVEATAKEKLKKSLLYRDDQGLVKVNFDPGLVRLLREVKHFHLMSLPIPESASEIFAKNEIYRAQNASLDHIVGMYNEIKQDLLPVEEPLLDDRIKKMDQTLEPGLRELKWRSQNINEFIQQSLGVVREVSTTVKTMQANLNKIKEIMHKWADKPLIERKAKPMNADDFDQAYKAAVAVRHSEIVTGGRDINRLIKETSECVKQAKKTPAWSAYVDYVNGIVIEGLASVITGSLKSLNSMMDPALIKKQDMLPLFDIKFELAQASLMFRPEIEENETESGIRDLTNGWVGDFLRVTTLFARIDSLNGDYLCELRDHMDVQLGLSSIARQLEYIELHTNKFKQNFMDYSYLWTEDLEDNFANFLKLAVVPAAEEGEENVITEEIAQHPVFEGVPIKIPELTHFHDKITDLKSVQSKVVNFTTPTDIAWLRIHVDPLKNALNKLLNMWIKKYTDFLMTNVTRRMSNLHKFIVLVSEGIQIEEDQDFDKSTLEVIMTHVRDVRTISDFVDEMFKPIRDQVSLLKKHVVMPQNEILADIENLKTKWEELKLLVNSVKAIILPHQTEETKAIKKRLTEFENQVEGFREGFLKTCPFDFGELSDAKLTESYSTLDQEYGELLKLEVVAKEKNNLNTLFELQKSTFRPLRECRQDLSYLKVIWDAIGYVHYMYNDWKLTLWDKINTEELLELNKNLDRMVKTLPKECRGWRAYVTLTDRVKNMSTILPLINDLHSPAMEGRHWAYLNGITGKHINPSSPTFCLDDLLSLHLHNHEEDVKEIVAQAEREANIEKKLSNIESAWKSCFLTFDSHKECPLIRSLDETVEMLEQHSMDLMSMQSLGKSVVHFEQRLKYWLKTLRTVDTVLSVWMKVQRNWRRLETIFLASEDIRATLHEETKLFEGIDNEFREIMKDAEENPSVVEACCAEGRQEALDNLASNIERCEKALNDYLEGKKKAFPRFYFLSNQALLDILSNANNPHKVCGYLGDCFDGMSALDFEKNPDGTDKISAVGLISKEGEVVTFPNSTGGGRFVCEGIVELWLTNLEAMMRLVLKTVLETARQTAEVWEYQGEKPREWWIDDYPAQISLVGTQIIWTEETTRAIEEVFVGSETAMKDYFKICCDRINKLIERVIDPKITRNERTKIITIITIDVHSRDVIDKFAVTKVSDVSEFAWQSQLKFAWEPDTTGANDCKITICDWRTLYSYEYVGNCGRLVITPLTDRCYITLTQALNLTMGGAPAGPAGTGKTETTKDLGRAVGLPVMVFNCSEQMNKDSMAQIFMGLSQTGAWGCFDEFNRISIEVLSVVSSQVKTVLDALKIGKKRFLFMEEDIVLVHTVGFFITMNPGYAGRTELPENLKALFRSCAMVVPDTMLICENMLMSEGFKLARQLSNKFVTLYELSRELLSKQKHYDWGLRAVKSVLRMAGKLRRADPTIEEDPLLMRALRDFNMPKIVTDDKSIFLRLIDDLFPGLDCPSKLNPTLQEQVKKATKAAKLQAEEMFVTKCVQLSEILEVRHSVFIIGQTGCGKSEVWKILQSIDGNLSAYETINPKAVTSNELYGYMTKAKEWKDGVLSVIMREMSKNLGHFKATMKNKWIVLDGDIDPNWIESLNTVMDDNKVLTLVSNERIPLTDPMRLIFEISNLRNATPATVSRAGVLFINDTDIGIKPYYDSWLETVDDDVAKSYFMLAYQQVLEPNLDEIHKFKSIVPRVDMAIIQTMCVILKSLISPRPFKDLTKNMKEEDKKLIYEAFYIYAGIWAIGAAIGEDRQLASFSNWWKGVAKKFPEADTVFDYYYDPKTLNWETWKDKVTEYQALGDQLFTNITVPTVEIVRLKQVLDLHVKGGKPTMFVGPAGTGKTTYVKDYFRGVNSEEVLFSFTNFNSYTDSLTLQRFLEANVEKRMGREYGPPNGKQLVFFIDDLNMPAVDIYFTQSPIALLVQILNYHQMYDRDHLEEQKRLKDVQFAACMNPKAGSFFVDLRLQRHFTTFSCLMPPTDTLRSIYHAILKSHLSQFDPSIVKLTDRVVSAVIDLFKLISENPQFSPSAKKFHYQFNLRDISKIAEGIMNATPSVYRSQPAKIVRLLIHECDRVYNDRLIDEKDMELYKEYLQRVVKPLEDVGEDVWVTPNIYTSFVSAHGGNDAVYLPIKEMPQLKKVLEDKLAEYNEAFAEMNLVLFDIAMEHICRIARIIGTPGGNALLVGVGGSGKQSLSRLASFILNYDVIQILVSQNYGMNELKVDLQEMYKKAAVKAGGAPCAFLLTDTQIQDERFLIYINDMLSSGYVQDLFSRDEADEIKNSLAGEAKGMGITDPAEVFEYFIDKSRRNLHVILCFSPVGEIFRVRARKFPALISCTAIDWFWPWPREALIDVGARFLQDVELPTEEQRHAIANNMAEVHLSIDVANAIFFTRERRRNYTTPKSFLELIAFFKKLLDSKRKKLLDKIERLEQGLTTLELTQNKVEGLKENLARKMVDVEQKQKQANELIEKVNRNTAIAEKEQEAASAEEAITSEASAKANKIRAEADEELKEAEPAMIEAKKAVDCLTKNSIGELKGFAKPPGGVEDVTKAVLIMRGEKRNFSWQTAQKMMGQPAQFIESLKGFNAENIDPVVLSQVEPLLKLPHFNHDTMFSKSNAASFLCDWVINIVRYNGIYNKVKPLMDRLEEAKNEVAKKEAELSIVRARVKDATDRVAGLQRELDTAIAIKEEVEADADKCRQELSLAERLVNGLGGEKLRWGENVKQFKIDANTVVGDSLLSAAFVSYIGPFSAGLRQQLWVQTWLPDLKNREIPYTEGVDPLRVLANEADEANWKNQGLPADRMSIENASIITSCSRWPLIIDPQLQGIKWIKGKEGEDLDSLQLTQDRWIKRVESAIQMGKVLIIENIGQELDAVLEPLLSRAIIKKGRNSLLIKLGAEEIEYDAHFRLYLQTKLSNPHYRPEIAAQCTIINFIVTESGLEDQLLAMVVKSEKPELEETKQELVRKQNDYKVILARLEEQLLNRLSEADPATILQNIELIESLETTKRTSEEIKEQTIEAQRTEIQINTAREVYRRVAAEGAMLYFLIIALCVVDHMYQYSLESFVSFFFKAKEKTPEFEEVEQRVLTLRENIRMTIYQWVSRGLFEKHKLIFLAQITLRLMQKGIIDTPYDPQMVDFLLRGPLKIDVERPAVLDWLPEASWFAVQKLIEIPDFQIFANDLVETSTRFKDWFNDLTPEDTKLPLEWKRLDSTPFQKLLVLRCLRPDRLTIAMSEFIRKAIPNGSNYVDMDQGLSFEGILKNVLEDSSSTTPVFFILSAGTDPVQDVEKIGKSRGIEEGKNYWNAPLGQGMDVVATKYLLTGHKEGHWVMLQNIHLMPNWLVNLEKMLDGFAQEGSNLNFRLFLSAEPNAGIPIGLLNRSIKLTNEPPQGMKANVKRAIAYFNPVEFDDKDNRVKSILFGLSFFHAIVIERRKFGSLGWNRYYPFSMGDLRDSAIVLTNYLPEGSTKIPWNDLRYIFGEIMYGGHIVDDWDRKLCKTYLELLMDNPLLDETEMFLFSDGKGASFRSPSPISHEKYIEHIDERFPPETPIAFAMHPNAEIGFRTNLSKFVLSTLLELMPKDVAEAAEGTVKTQNEIASEIVDHILEDMNIDNLKFDLEEIKSRVPEQDDRKCYINVFLQECEYMNYLLDEVSHSLKEIRLALKGELTSTEQMERTIDSLVIGRVPTNWQELAYPSIRGLSSWLTNLNSRCEQLGGWKDEPVNIPKVVNIAKLFNPQSFLTAIKQYSAQHNHWELNKLYIVTEITKRTEAEIEGPAREGAYITGMNLQGARWDIANNQVEESKPKEMYCPLPIVNCKAAMVIPEGKEDKNIYQCPVYKIENRMGNYVFTAQLRSPRYPPARWVLAGAAIILDVEGIGEPIKK
jgi:dynein heavy chain